LLGRRLKTGLAVCLAAVAFGSLATSAAAGTLYANDYGSKQISAFSIGSDGLLSPIAGSPFATPNYPISMAITPDGQVMVTSFLYEHSVGSYLLSPDGALSLVGSPLPAPNFTRGVSVSPNAPFAYVSLQTGGILAFAIAADGSLGHVGEPFGSADGYPGITPNGSFLLAPNYSGEAIDRFAVQADGTLAALGSTPVTGVSPMIVRVTPDGRFAVLMSETGAKEHLQSFAIGADGGLTPTGSELETEGNVAGLPVVSPDGRFLYVANGNEDSVTVYSIGANGELTQVGEPVPSVLTDPTGIAISVDGRFLYVEPAYGDFIQAFSVGSEGTLTPVDEPVATGETDIATPITRPSAPVASFKAKASAPHTKTSFDASASSDSPPNKIVSYEWDFGDGAKQTSAKPKVNHVYKKAGVYEAKLSVTDDNGCRGFSYTGQSAYCGGRDATATVDTPPAIFGLKLTPKRFFTTRAGGKRKLGTTFHFKLSEKARVRFTIKRKRRGRKPKKVGVLRVKGKAGKNRRRFRGKLKGRPLPPGAYLAVAKAIDSHGGRSVPRTVAFKVKP